MGLLETVSGPLGAQIAQRGTVTVVAGGFVAFLVLSVVLNVLKQLLLKNPNEPPVVFHWFPVVGNTVMYGMDPYKFFFECRAKVSFEMDSLDPLVMTVRTRFS
jgi:sterol 14-demethylase